jgi:hypothetical protein
MIVSASRRTDIPAFYPDWLMGRIEAGYCFVRNPFDARKRRRVSLEPADLDFLVLWTRDPRPLARRLREIEARGIRFYVQMTLTGYPRSMEPGAPPLPEAVDALCDLSDRIGADRALWRYDPVILAKSLDQDYHLRAFERIAASLEGRARRVTLSVVDEYSGTSSRLAAGFAGLSFDVSEYESLLAGLAAIARSRGMLPVACAEETDLRRLGIEAGACIDAELAASAPPTFRQPSPRPTALLAVRALRVRIRGSERPAAARRASTSAPTGAAPGAAPIAMRTGAGVGWSRAVPKMRPFDPRPGRLCPQRDNRSIFLAWTTWKSVSHRA